MKYTIMMGCGHEDTVDLKADMQTASSRRQMLMVS